MVILAIISGMVVVVNISLNGNNAQRLGQFKAVGLNVSIGMLATGIALWLYLGHSAFSGSLSGTGLIFASLSGVLGVLTTLIFNVLVHEVPAFEMVLLRFIGQIAFSAGVDFIWLEKFSLGKGLGGICLLVGLMLFTEREGGADETQNHIEFGDES